MSENILLVNPWYEYKNTRVVRYTRAWPPLDLAIAAALLENEGINVDILDLNAEKIKPELAAKKTTGYDKIFITSTPLDRWQCPAVDLDSFLYTVQQIKDSTESKIYITGTHGTVKTEDILRLTRADGVILGEPEYTILDICKKNLLKDVLGIAFTNNGEMIQTSPRPLINLAELPLPAFHLLPMKKYFYEILGDNFTLLETTRGCPYLCNFCAENIMYGVPFRKKPFENIERELDLVVNEFGVKSLYFIDLEFTLVKRDVHKICDLLIEKDYDLVWTCQTRADTVDYELLRHMKRAGCELIHYGVESGSPKVLASTRKNITHEQIEEGVTLAKKVGMDVVCFLMMGFPGETIRDMRMTIDFAKKLDPTYASFNVATPYPGTDFYKQVKDEVDGVWPASYNGKYPVELITHMTKRAFLQFYLRPNYLLKRLKTSPKFLLRQANVFWKFVNS